MAVCLKVVSQALRDFSSFLKAHERLCVRVRGFDFSKPYLQRWYFLCRVPRLLKHLVDLYFNREPIFAVLSITKMPVFCVHEPNKK